MYSFMKRKELLVIICVLVVRIFASTSVAATISYDDYAEKLNELGVFNGTATGYELDREPTRVEAAVMFVRLIGAENESKERQYSHPFNDVPNWADGYIGYLYTNNLTNGKTSTTFGSNDIISAEAYITFVLRAIGYNDSNGDFVWNQSIDFCRSNSLLEDNDCNELVSSVFYRAQLAKVSYLALEMRVKGEDISLIDKLVEQEQIDEDIATKVGLIVKGSSDEETKPNPKPSYSDWDAKVQIVVESLGYVGTAIKANMIADMEFKSKDGTSFSIIDLKIINLNEVLDKGDNVLSYVATEYKAKESSFDKLNNLIKDDTVSFLDLINSLANKDFTVVDYGNTMAPDKSGFTSLRKVYSYEFLILDNEGNEIPMQVFIETFIDVSGL